MSNPLQLPIHGHGHGAAYSQHAPGSSSGSSGGGPQQPLVSLEDPAAARRPAAAAAAWRLPRDDGRSVAGLAPAPSGPLVAAVDGLGRVLLVDTSTAAVVRIWKVGRRNHPWAGGRALRAVCQGVP